MAESVTPFRRSLSTAPPPIGLYFRVGHTDHRMLQDLIASSRPPFHGGVFDASLVPNQLDLVIAMNQAGYDTILDPVSVQAATIGGWKNRYKDLGWVLGDQPQSPASWSDLNGRRACASLAAFAIKHSFSAVLAPTHYIASLEDEWLERDIQNARQMKSELSGAGVQVIYRLVVDNRLIDEAQYRTALVSLIEQTGCDAVWLAIDRFDSHASVGKFRAYHLAASAFHQLGIPVVGDQIGGLPGLGLAAVGAVGGLACGIGAKERFESRSLFVPPSGGGGGSGSRIYSSRLGMSLKPAHLELLLGSRQARKSQFACLDHQACPTGPRDMLKSPQQLFVRERSNEVVRLSGAPRELRGGLFMEEFVRSASDNATSLALLSFEGPDGEQLQRALQKQAEALSKLRVGLSEHLNRMPSQSFAINPPTRIARPALR